MSSSEILRQVEFYFSDVNLINDKFMSENVKEKGGLPLATLLTFKRMSKYDAKEVERVITEDSQKLTLEEGLIKRNDPLPDLEDKKKLREDLNNKTAVLKDVPSNWNLDFLQEKLADSKVNAIRIKKNGLVFVSFDTVEDAQAFVDSELKIDDKVIQKQKETEWFAEKKQSGPRPQKGKNIRRGGNNRDSKRAKRDEEEVKKAEEKKTEAQAESAAEVPAPAPVTAAETKVEN